MHIAVIIRLVPDLSEEIEFSEDETDVDREYIDLMLNEFDQHALEEAILLKERTGAKVTAIAVNSDGIKKQLRMAWALGADDLVLIEANELDPRDVAATARHIKAAVEDLSVDLVLTGVQTPEDVVGQLSPYLAGCFGWPSVNAVSGIVAEENTVLVNQEYSGGKVSVIRVELPCVIGVQAASQPPRYVSGSRLREAAAVEIKEVTPNNNPDAKLSARVVALREPETGEQAVIFDGDIDEVATKILDIISNQQNG